MCIDMQSMMETSSYEDNMNKHLDVFISYRRSTGSQLARYGSATPTKYHTNSMSFSDF